MKLLTHLIPHTNFHKGIWLSNENVPWYFFLKTDREFEIPNGDSFYDSVDECLLPIVKKLHNNNIPTTPSCAGHFENRKYYSEIYDLLKMFENNLKIGEILHDDENDRQFYYENSNYKLPWSKNVFLDEIIDYQKNGVIGFLDNDKKIFKRLKNKGYDKLSDNGITIIKIKPKNIDEMEKSWKTVYNDLTNNI